ncbi:hypothetical protein ABPG75_005483 [Micractinium tetrahymenae]
MVAASRWAAGKAARPRLAAAAALLPAALLALLLLPPPRAAALTLPGMDEEKTITQEDPVVTKLKGMLSELREKVGDNPSDFKSLLEMGTLLARLNELDPDGGKRVPQALAAFRHALDLAHDPQVRSFVAAQMGDLLLAARFHREAVHILNQTVPLAQRSGLGKTDTFARMLLHFAKAQRELGNEGEAQRLFARALKTARKVSPHVYAQAWLGLEEYSEREVKELEDCAEFLRRRREGVDEEHLSDGEMDEWLDLAERWTWLDGELKSKKDQSAVAYALAAAHRQQGRHEEAWQALHDANEVRRTFDLYTRVDEEDNVGQLLRTFQVPKAPEQFENEADAVWAALLQGRWGYRNDSLRPIFVVGLPRSGAALLERILTRHSQVGSIGGQSALPTQLRGLLDLLAVEGELPTANITAAGNRTLARMRRQVGEKDAAKAGARFVLDRMLPNLWNIGFIATSLPDACILHVERHPADQGLSCYEQPFEGKFTRWSFNLSDIAHQVLLMQRVAEHWDALAPRRVLHVRYEDLVREQERVIRLVMDHCGIPWDDSVLKGGPKLHTQRVQRFRGQAHVLEPLLRPLRQLILRYERSAGLLEYSGPLLESLLGPEEEEGRKDDAGSISAGSSSGRERAEAEADGAREEL